MSETPDKRRRTDLDLFVLALIDGGVSTPYELQKTAGLSQGATIPALQRLLEARLVRQGKPGARGRTDYKATASGKKLLRGGWLPLIEAGPSGDLDSDLRVALLAIWAGGERQMAADFLRRSGKLKMESVAAAELTSDPVAPLAGWYVNLRSSTAKALLAAEVEATLYNQDDDWVFASPYTKGKRPYWPESALADHIRPAAVEAKITKRVGWNTVRHFLASLLGDKKEDRRIVQEIMRHASGKMLDVYQHGNLEAKRLALNHASGLFVLPAKAS